MWSKLLWEGFSRFEGKFRLAQAKFLVADVCDPGRAQLSLARSIDGPGLRCAGHVP